MKRLVGLVLSGGKDCHLWVVKASVTSKWRIAGWIEATCTKRLLLGAFTRSITRMLVGWYCI